MNLSNLTNEQIHKVKDFYQQAVIKYENCSKPLNYICPFIKRRLDFVITDEQIYLIANNLTEEKKCVICGKPTRFINFSQGYLRTCSKECFKKRTSISSTGRSHVCPFKGKTYKEIYGNRNVKCGFQKGEFNVAKRSEIRQKISEKVKNSYDKDNGRLRKLRSQQQLSRNLNKVLERSRFSKNLKAKDGNFYRSSLEVDFANTLIDNNIPFQYEVPVRMSNNHRKVVDFVIDGKLFIEISGYAYEKWRNDFDQKMKLFDFDRDIDNSIIFILVYRKNLNLIVENQKNFVNQNDNLFYDAIEDKNHWLRGINFYRSILNFQENIKCLS